LPGTLYLVGTPIGNLEDMTPRAVRIMREADVIAAEDTRRTIKLLNHFGIKTPMISYHEHNERERAEELVARLAAGENVALVTDAGMPGISDPGETLVRATIQAGVTVVPVPGPSACLLALAGSGLPTAEFRFVGFLPRQRQDCQVLLAGLANERATIVLYEAPHRLNSTLQALVAAMGGERPVTVARELTKVHEEFWRGDLAGALIHYDRNPAKGEVTLVLAGKATETAACSLEEGLARVEKLVAAGESPKDAVRDIAQLVGLAKNALYQAYLDKKTSQKRGTRPSGTSPPS